MRTRSSRGAALPRLVGRALLVVSALVAVACADDGAQPDGAEPDETTSSTSSTSTTSSPTTSTLVPPTPTDPPEVPLPVIGDLELPCGATDTLRLAESVGIDQDSITIGTGNDRGGIATLGAGRGIGGAVVAVADHCNSLGGLAGREIVVIDYDAAVVEIDDRFAQACTEVFAMVGHRFLLAAEAASAAEACPLPDFASGPLLRSPFPLHGHLAAAFAAPASSSVVLVGPDTTVSAFERVRRLAALAESPVPLATEGTIAYPVDRPPDWEQIVADARATGAGVVHLEGGCDHAIVPFLTAAASAGWDPIVLAGVSAYDPACLTVGDLTDRLLIELPLLPYEDGDAAPATQEHAALFDAIGTPRTGEALLAASAFWRWVVVSAECGEDLDRDCVTGGAAVEEWTGGGLHPAMGDDETMEPCVVVMAVSEGTFVRRLPAEPGVYDCTPEWAVEL